jgi:hypothetical protein
VDERQVGHANENQNRKHDEDDDRLRELAPDAEINFHPVSLTARRHKVKAVFIVTTKKVGNLDGGMIKVFFLIFEPAVAWEKIALAGRGFVFILATNLLPLLLLVTAVEGWGLKTWGKWQPPYQKFREFTPHEIIGFEAVQFVLVLAAVLVSALLILRVSQTFHQRQNYLQAFTVTVYGISPLLFVRLLDAAPTMNPVVTWLIGVILSIWILYQGLPRVLMPDPTHAFGLYISSALVIVLTTGLTRLITAMYLLGYIDFNHSWLSRKISQLLGQ